MNMAKLRAAFTRNKVTLGVLGAAAVAGLALVARQRKAGDVAADPAASDAGGAGSAAQVAGYAAYDSTDSDVYNLIQPQLEELRRIATSIPVPTDPIDTAGTRSWIRDLYRTTLRREVSEPDLDMWMGRFETGELTRPELETHLRAQAAAGVK